MKIKTEGKCIGCGEKYTPAKGCIHVLKCAGTLKSLLSPAKLEEGYLVRVSGAEQPNTYWMVITVPKNLISGDLDEFLRDIRLECCGHLSEFKIGGRSYISHTEAGNPSQSMKKQVDQLLSRGMELKYRHDLGSSTGNIKGL